MSLKQEGGGVLEWGNLYGFTAVQTQLKVLLEVDSDSAEGVTGSRLGLS